MVVMALLVGLAMPSMSTWIRNSRLRAASDSLQDGLRLAQAEALRRSRQVVFSLTNDEAHGQRLHGDSGRKQLGHQDRDDDD